MGELVTTRCNKCRQLIVFIRTEKGTAMPCNAAPLRYLETPNGQLRLYTRYGKLVRCDEVNGNTGEFTGFGYQPHWGNCLSREGRERFLMRKQVVPPKNAVAKKEKPPSKEAAPKFEQICLWQERRRLHPEE